MKLTLKSKESGSLLLITLFTAGIIGVAIASYLKMVQGQNQSVVRSQAWNSAMPACEAGLEEALTHLNVVGRGDRATHGWELSDGRYRLSRTIGEMRYSVSISTDLQPDIISAGYAIMPASTNEVSRAVKVTTTTFGSGLKGLVAVNDVTMSGICVADSFDSLDPNYSTGGHYDGAKHKDNGFVGSVLGSISVGNGKIYGSVATGPSGSASGLVGNMAWVDGSGSGVQTGHYSKDLNVAFPPVAAPFSGGGLTPLSGNVTTTNFAYTSTATTSTTLPNPIPAGGVTTNNSTITTAAMPASWSGTLTTNTSATSSKTSPAAGTYVGNITTRNVTTGPPANRGTWYDYTAIIGYTYQALNYTWNTVTTNATTSTTSYDYVLGTGNYQTAGLSMSGQSKMCVKGDAVLYITGNFSMSGQSQITILPGASLTVYVAGPSTSLSGNGIMNLNMDASKFSYLGLPSNTSISLTGNAAFTGTIYAPSADFQLGGGGNNVYDCVGSTLTKTVNMNGHFNFHYDERLGRSSTETRYVVASWNEILQ